MFCIRSCHCLVVLFLISVAGVEAQHTRQIETGFEREVSRFRWTSTALYEMQVASWELIVRNRFVSDAFILFDDQLRFRDEDRLTVMAQRPLGRRLKARIHARTAWFGLSRVFTQEIYSSLQMHPLPSGWVEPILGIAWDRRPGALSMSQRLDVGPAFGAGFHFASTSMEETQLRLSGEGIWQRITPRRGRSVHIIGGLRRRFGVAQLSTDVRLSSQRRDSYQAASFLNRDVSLGLSPETVEATTNDTLEVNLQVDAPLFRGFRLLGQADVQVNSRLIRTHHAPEETLFFETDFNRRSLNAELGLVYEQGDTAVRLAVQGGATTERRQLANREALPPSEASQKINLLRQADYEEGEFGLQGRMLMTLLPRLVLSMNGNSRIVRHDTPEANPDDRDELYHNGELGLQWRMNHYIQADIKLFGSYYHTVYLNAGRSAENSVQRSLRLRPSMRWRPTEQTNVRFSTEVRATYTVDDHLLPGRRPTDQSAREVRIETDIEQGLPGGMRMEATGSYADLRLGRLLWGEFAEIPFDTLRTYSGWIHVQTGRRLIADIGWRFFLRSDFDRSLRVAYPLGEEGEGMATILRPGRRSIRQQGPTAAITWTMGMSTLRLDAWMNIQHIRQRLYGALPETAADRIRTAARRGTRKLIPTIALTVLWSL